MAQALSTLVDNNNHDLDPLPVAENDPWADPVFLVRHKKTF